MVLCIALCQNCVFYKGSTNRLDWMLAVFIFLSMRNQAYKERVFLAVIGWKFHLRVIAGAT